MLAVSRPALPSPFSVRRGPAAIWAPRTILSGPQRLPVPVASAFEQRHATHAALAGGEASRPLEQMSQLQTLVVASAEAPQQEVPWWKRWLPKVISFAAVLGLAASLALASPGAALAKGSGGRAGGRVSSSARSSSYSSKSSSSHSSSSFGFGGSSYSSSSSSSLSRASRLAPSTSSSTTIVVQPSYRFGIPFGGSYYPSVGIPSDVPVGVSSYSAMDSFFDMLGTLLVISVFLFVLFGPAIEAAMNSSGSSSSSSTYAPPLTFVTLQVGILAVDEVLQPALVEVADGADTNSTRGLQQLLQDACLVMLRRPEYCAYGRLAVRTGLDERKADAAFDSASLEERAKFREETRVNVGGRKRNKAGNSRSKLGARAGEAEVPHEVVVVTLLVAATGDVASRLPRNVRNSADAAQALRALAALAPGDIHGVELLWTPEAEGDSLSKEELLTDYPTLAPLV